MAGERAQIDPGKGQHVDHGHGRTGQGDDHVVQAVMAGAQVTPTSVADALRTHPGQRAAIMRALHQHYGNAFVEQVLAQEGTSAPVPDTMSHAAPALALLTTPDPSKSIIDNTTRYADVVDQQLGGFGALLEAYQRARDALDQAAVQEIGGTALATIELILAAMLGMDKQLGRAVPAHVSTAGGDPAQELEQAALDQQLDGLRARRDQQRGVLTSWEIALAMTLAPLRFRGAAIPDVQAPKVDVDSHGHVDVRPRANEDLVRTLTVLQDSQALLVEFAAPGALHDQGRLMGARVRLGQIAHRPADLAFLRAIMMGNGLWQALDTDEGTIGFGGRPKPATAGPLGIEVCTDDGPLSGLYAETKKQAAQTGWQTDIGRWDFDLAAIEIRTGGSESLNDVYNQIMNASLDGRAAILYQLQRANLLEKFLEPLPWRYTKDIHDGLPTGHSELKTALQAHFLVEGKWGTNLEVQEYHAPSVTKMLNDAADDVGGIGGSVISGFDSALNFATLGFTHSYGQASDAHNQGLINDDEYHTQMNQIAVRTTVGMAIMMATAGTARAAMAAPLPNLMMEGAPTVGQTALTAGVEGGTFATAEMFAMDTADVATGAKAHYSSLTEYLLAALAGGALAGGTAATASWLSSRASRYLSKGALSRAQALTSENPTLGPVMDQLQGARAGARVTVRITLDEAYALREAGLIDAETHRAIRAELATQTTGEVEIDVEMVNDLHQPHKPRAANAADPVYDAPSMKVSKVGPVSGTGPAPVRPATTTTTLEAGLPQGTKIVKRSPDDSWVVYEDASGEERMRFRAKDAVTLNEAAPGRNRSPVTHAAVNTEGKAFVLEGKHRGAGAAQGDVIGTDKGGVRGQPGVLDYRYSSWSPDEVGEPLTGVKIDYTAKDVDAAPLPSSAKKGR